MVDEDHNGPSLLINFIKTTGFFALKLIWLNLYEQIINYLTQVTIG